jgi:hypothetical protein
VTLTVFGLAFRLSIHGGALAWVAVISLMAYVASFAISLGPIFWLLILGDLSVEDSRSCAGHCGYV